MTETGIIATVLSFIVSIVLAVLQFINLRKQAKNEEIKESSVATLNLVDSALKINKQELQTSRDISEDLKLIIKAKDAEILEKENTITKLETRIQLLEQRIEEMNKNALQRR